MRSIDIIQRWMDYVGLSLSDLDIDEPLEQLDENRIQELLEEAEEDRSRLICDGCFIREDWTEAT